MEKQLGLFVDNNIGFWQGMAHALDIGTTLNSYNEISPMDIDTISLANDWSTVGQALAKAMSIYE